jgi:hypothetical protein
MVEVMLEGIAVTSVCNPVDTARPWYRGEAVVSPLM